MNKIESNKTLGISYTNVNVLTTANKLINVLGKPNAISGDNKSKWIWNLQNTHGDYCCVYDWKNKTADADTEQYFHIGAFGNSAAQRTMVELNEILSKPQPITEIEDKHEKLRNILISYGCEEYGDCIVDEICELFNFPTTNEDEQTN